MNYSNWLDQARAFAGSGKTRSGVFRREQLQRLEAALLTHESALLQALKDDLGKPAVEAYTSEIGYLLSEVRHALRHLKTWMRRKRRPAPLIAWPSRAYVQPEPRGVVLIIGPWNYPVQLLLSPLVAAIAAGNSAALKPSELAPRTSLALAKMLADTFDPAYITLFEGDAETALSLIHI